MAKRFVDPDWKALRKLSANIQRAYFYCWDKADACGVYAYDPLYMKADLGVSLKMEELKKLPGVKILPGERIFFLEFIQINYGTLKEGYNPHKPAFRALSKNKISSYNEACFKLEEEGEDEEEDKDEGEKEEEGEIGGSGGNENPFGKNFKAWEGWVEYKRTEHGQKYKDPRTETAALNKLFALSRGDPETAKKIIEQSIANQWKGLFDLKNQQNGSGKTNSKVDGQQLNEAFAKFYSKT